MKLLVVLLVGLLVIALAPQAARSAAAQVAVQKSDSALWKKVEAELKSELAPELKAAKKKLEWVGVSGRAVLALVGRYENESEVDALYEAYSLPLASDSHKKLETKEPKWILRYERELAATPSSPVTALFAGLSCTKCEPTKILVAFSPDAAGKAWSVVHWKASETYDQVGLDETTDEGWQASSCAVGSVANEKKQMSDLGIWCRIHDVPNDAGRSATYRFARKADVFVYTELADEAQAHSLRVELCKRPVPSAKCFADP